MTIVERLAAYRANKQYDLAIQESEKEYLNYNNGTGTIILREGMLSAFEKGDIKKAKDFAAIILRSEPGMPNALKISKL